MQSAVWKSWQIRNLFFSVNILPLIILMLLGGCSALTLKAQTLNNMTDEEDLAIRDAQELDERMNIYVRIVDRRFLALSEPNAAESKQAQKDFEKYGKLRTGTPAKLHADIARTIQEATNKIDDVAERDQKNPLFAKSVRIVIRACERWMPLLKTSFDNSADEIEKVAVTNSIQECGDIIDAGSKLQKENPKDEKKKKSKDDSN